MFQIILVWLGPLNTFSQELRAEEIIVNFKEPLVYGDTIEITIANSSEDYVKLNFKQYETGFNPNSIQEIASYFKNISKDSLSLIQNICSFIKSGKFVLHFPDRGACDSHYEPLLFLNSYGQGICSQFATTFAHLLRYTLVFNEDNIRIVSTDRHVLAEVLYRNKWMMCDCDPGTPFMNIKSKRGKYLSVAELASRGERYINLNNLYVPPADFKMHKFSRYQNDLKGDYILSEVKDTIVERHPELILPPNSKILFQWVKALVICRVDYGNLLYSIMEYDGNEVVPALNTLASKLSVPLRKLFELTHSLIVVANEDYDLWIPVKNSLRMEKSDVKIFIESFPYVIRSVQFGDMHLEQDINDCETFEILKGFKSGDYTMQINFFFNPNLYEMGKGLRMDYIAGVHGYRPEVKFNVKKRNELY